MSLSAMIAAIPKLTGEAVAVQLPDGMYELIPAESIRARTALWLMPEAVLGTYNRHSDPRFITDDAIAVKKQLLKSA